MMLCYFPFDSKKWDAYGEQRRGSRRVSNREQPLRRRTVLVRVIGMVVIFRVEMK